MGSGVGLGNFEPGAVKIKQQDREEWNLGSQGNATRAGKGVREKGILTVKLDKAVAAGGNGINLVEWTLQIPFITL